jgi:hypothetical protein
MNYSNRAKITQITRRSRKKRATLRQDVHYLRMIIANEGEQEQAIVYSILKLKKIPSRK